jgi:putative flippase GtrA
MGIEMIQAMKRFKTSHADLYEFIMFNILSNIATITNFVVLNLGNSLLFASLTNRDFTFGFFDYTAANGGLGGFLSFLLSYACAQTVNFIVQRKLVFASNNKLGKSIPVYIITILAVYLICLYVPTLVVEPLTKIVGRIWATNLANIINILIQVVVNYPVMKFVIMRKVDKDEDK